MSPALHRILLDAQTVLDFRRLKARKRLWQELRIYSTSAYAEGFRAHPGARVQIHTLRRLAEVRSDPMSDVIHGQRANAPDTANLGFDQVVERGEIGRGGKLP